MEPKLLPGFTQLTWQPYGSLIRLTLRQDQPPIDRVVHLAPDGEGQLYGALAKNEAGEEGLLLYCDQSGLRIDSYSHEGLSAPGGALLEGHTYPFVWIVRNNAILPAELEKELGIPTFVSIVATVCS